MNRIIGIAIDEYFDNHITNLNNCYNDISQLTSMFMSKFKFESIDIFSQTEQTTKTIIYNSLYDLFINSSENDNILLLYAGHGEYNPRTESSFWLTCDSKKYDTTTWLNINDILNLFQHSPAKHIALVSDSCFSGAIFSHYRGGGTQALEANYSRYALTSGSLEKVSDGVKNSLSPFANTIINFLNEFKDSQISFSELSEKIIRDFPKEETQTPLHGALVNSGHKGGLMILRSKLSNDLIQSLDLDLKLNSNIKIDSTIEVPNFKENNKFESKFINSFVLQKAYKIINDIRISVTQNEEFFIDRTKEFPFLLNIGYNIELLNDNFLSMTLSSYDYFGGAHPNSYIYTFNFTFKPERLISLDSLIDYSGYESFHNFLETMIRRFAHEQQIEHLLNCIQYTTPWDFEFTFNDKNINLYFIRYMPRVYLAHAFLDIPIEQIKFKI